MSSWASGLGLCRGSFSPGSETGFQGIRQFDAQTHLSVNVPPLNANATPIYNSHTG